MLQLLKVGFQLLRLSVKLWEVEGDACGLLVVVYQLLVRLAVPQFGSVVAVGSMCITILSSRCVWARHDFVEQPHQPSAQLSGLFVGHVRSGARHHPFFRHFGRQPACGLVDGGELFSQLFGEIVFAKTTE